MLNSRDIAALNRARDVLRRVEDAAWNRSLGHYDPYAPVSAWDLGRLSEAASVADDAIFHVLSTARTNCGLNITDEQVAGPDRAQEEAVPSPQAAHLPVAQPPDAAHSPEAAEPTRVIQDRASERIADASATNWAVTRDLRVSGR